MFNLPVVLIFFSIIALIFAYNKIDAQKLSYKHYIFLVFSPPILMGIAVYIYNLYIHLIKNDLALHTQDLLIILSVSLMGLIIMAPSLLFYATIVLLIKKKSTSALSLFVKTALVSAGSASPYILTDIEFGLGLMGYAALTGTISMVILYYFTQWRAK